MPEAPGPERAPASVRVEGAVSVADGIEHRLDPSWVDLQRVVGWIVCAVLAPLLLIGVLIVAFLPSVSLDVKALLGVAWFAIVLLLMWLAQRWPAIEYKYFRYSVDADGIMIRAGVVWRRVISVPRTRVQHIDVAQGPIDRRYGLASLSIYTAGTDFAKVDLPGLSYGRAIEIRDHLLLRRQAGDDDGT